MKLLRWNELPEYMQTSEVKIYYDYLLKKRGYLLIKRFFDIYFSLALLILLAPCFVIISLIIYLNDKGPVFFTQERITQFGRKFKIYKFRVMVKDAESKGTLVTIKNDNRLTRVGVFLRRYRLDEFPQLINVLLGDMSFVGTRPEVKKYVDCYTPEMNATLLLPAGITSETSIAFKNEDSIFGKYIDTMSIDDIYVNKILPEKMKQNLVSLRNVTLCSDFITMLKTVIKI